MGVMHSKADAETAPPAMPSFAGGSPAIKAAIADIKANAAKVDYLNLPPPVKYEDISREILMSLKPDLFEGLRFEITRPLNNNFFLQHSLFMGNIEVPSPNQKQIIKVPVGTYEFGANCISEKHFALGRITSDGRLSARLKTDLTDWASLKVHMQLSNDPGQSQVMADTDIKGKDWNAQLKWGNPSFYGVNYLQSVTPHLSVGGEFFWLGQNLKSGVGIAARHATDDHIATAQAATTGILSLQYAHKVTEKITLVSDFLWHWTQREATAAVGYDCMLRQCRLRGKMDTNGTVSCYIEERFAPGINFLLSAELEHMSKNYKIGFGVSAGE